MTEHPGAVRMRVFVSYGRRDLNRVQRLRQALELIGCEVWIDLRTRGGRPWWDEVLTQIRSCDLFVAVLSPASLESSACIREHGYARDLGKPVLPVTVAAVEMNTLPSSLASLNILDYTSPDNDQVGIRLVLAVQDMPPAPPLPVPLPTPPEIPLSELASLRERIDAGSLNQTEQVLLVSDLRHVLRGPTQRSEAMALARILAERRDLYKRVYTELSELITSVDPSPVPVLKAEDNGTGLPSSAAVSDERQPMRVAFPDRVGLPDPISPGEEAVPAKGIPALAAGLEVLGQAMRVAVPGHDQPEGEVVRLKAVRCFSGHWNDLQSKQCRVCRGVIPTQDFRMVVRPSLGELLFDDGSHVEVDRTIVLGRDPDPGLILARSDTTQSLRLHRMPSPHGQIARTQALVQPSGWDVVLVDFGGTTSKDLLSTRSPHLRAPDATYSRPEPGVPAVLETRTRVDFGQDGGFVFRATSSARGEINSAEA